MIWTDIILHKTVKPLVYYNYKMLIVISNLKNHVRKSSKALSNVIIIHTICRKSTMAHGV